MKRFDVVTVGGATEDIFFTVDDYVMIDNAKDPLRQKLVGFEYGSKIGVSETQSAFGGGAANTAVCFSRLGKKTAAIIALGRDERGLRMIENFKKHKIDCQCLEKTDKPSGVSFVLKTLDGEHVLFTHRGANDRLLINKTARKALAKAKRIFMTSLTGNWKTIAAQVFDSGRPIAWNPGRAQLASGFKSLKPFLEKTDILILNKDEAIELLLSYPKENGDNEASSYLLKKIHSLGPRLVVITEGARGACAYDGKKIYKQGIVKVKVVDTTGVGDAFGSTLVAALDSGLTITQALRAGMKNTASVLTKPGAQNGLLGARQLGL